GAHASTHLLHHDQGDGDGDHRPEEGVAELRSGLRIGKDASGIVVDIRGDEARAYDGEEQQEPELPTSQKFHARRPQRNDQHWQNRTIRINAESTVWVDESANEGRFFAGDLEVSTKKRAPTLLISG